LNELKLMRRACLICGCLILCALVIFHPMKSFGIFILGIVATLVFLFLIILIFAPPPRPKQNKLKQDQKRDKCQFCLGAKGGKPGNENRIDGVITCDCCQSLLNDIDAERSRIDNE